MSDGSRAAQLPISDRARADLASAHASKTGAAPSTRPAQPKQPTKPSKVLKPLKAWHRAKMGGHLGIGRKDNPYVVHPKTKSDWFG